MKIDNCKIENYSKGFAAIVSVLAIMGLGLIFSSGFLFVTLRNSEALRDEINSARSYYAAEAGIEDAIYRVKYNLNLSSSNVLTIDDFTATTTVATVGNLKTITAEGGGYNAIRRAQTILTVDSSEVDFFYGVQVGEGGVEMGQNSRIVGGIYSNGSIVGSSGATIDGDVQVAAGSNPTLDANWTAQNTDFSFGNTVGAVLTTVDSVNNVGEYTSIALGLDGFARISYMDDSSDDLKFVRCLDADCASKNISVVDATGSVYEVTSLVLDANDLARISYYHDGNDDLKYAQCIDADCTTRNLVIIDSALNMGDFNSIALTSGGLPRFGYWYDSYKDVRYATCSTASCSGRTNTIVETSGDVGEYVSMKLGSDDFGRMSHYDASNTNLKFIRCTNDTCSSAVRKTVDSDGNVGMHTSLALGTDGFARISYYDSSNSALKFVRCTDADCTTKNISTVDNTASVGEYTSIALGADGFARISYYDSSNSALKFVRCTNADCTEKNISTVDNSASVGTYTSMALGSDDFARISYYDATGDDLKFVRCIDADCTGSVGRADVAQSFRIAADAKIRRVSLYIKKVGSPANIPVRIVTDEGGRPGDSSGDIVASGTLAASAVTGSYGWVDVSFTTNPTLSASQTYWLMADTSIDNSNYWVWGGDSLDGYAQGIGRYSADWDAGVWTDIGGDFDFKIWTGGSDASVSNVSIGGNAYAHTISDSTIGGSVEATIFSDSTAGGSVTADDISSCTIGGNAAYNIKTSCTIGGTETSPTAVPEPPPLLNMPISQSNINKWHADAALGGVITGDYTISDNVSLGPKEITGDLIMTSNNKTLTVAGTIYVHGDIDISNGSAIKCDASYGADSCVILNDGWTHLSNNGSFSGSGIGGSYLLMLSTLACDGSSATAPGGEPCGHHNGAIDVHNQAEGVIFYAANGMINLHNGVRITEATAYKLRLDNTAVVEYQSGLADTRFSSGPSGGWKISEWREVQ